jgi:xylan 1,4-beta-xylosidase
MKIIQVVRLVTVVLGVSAVAFGAQSADSSSNTAVRQIAADVSRVTGSHSDVPLMVVGAGRANEGLRADWQGQLDTVQREIGFRYIRFHGLLHDDMGVYTEDAAGNPSYNFQYVDALYDALLAKHIRPFVELSFMPAKLASGDATVFWWKGNITPPKDMKKWDALIRALITHWRERYGEAEISSWYYEVWNEPDIKPFFTGTLDDYLDLYRNTAAAVKDACPTCRVGGPASATPGYEAKLLAFAGTNHVPLDFISTHTYGVKAGAFDDTGHKGTILNTSPDSIVGRVREAREEILHSATPKIPLYFTEWSSSYTPTDFIHDQYHQASFIVDRLRKTVPLADAMSYWTFTDIFEENGPRFTPFHGGFGLMNYQGIRKPAFFAYKFLAQLGKSDVAETDTAPNGPQSWITTSGNGVQALFWDYTPIAPPAGEIDQVFYKKEQPSLPAAPVELTLDHLKPGRYNLKVYRVGYLHNDAYTAYLHMGAPSQLTRDQVAALDKIASGDPEESRFIEVPNGTFHQRFAMNQNDVYLVTLTGMP